MDGAMERIVLWADSCLERGIAMPRTQSALKAQLQSFRSSPAKKASDSQLEDIIRSLQRHHRLPHSYGLRGGCSASVSPAMLAKAEAWIVSVDGRLPKSRSKLMAGLRSVSRVAEVVSIDDIIVQLEQMGLLEEGTSTFCVDTVRRQAAIYKARRAADQEAEMTRKEAEKFKQQTKQAVQAATISSVTRKVFNGVKSNRARAMAARNAPERTFSVHRRNAPQWMRRTTFPHHRRRQPPAFRGSTLPRQPLATAAMGLGMSVAKALHARKRDRDTTAVLRALTARKAKKNREKLNARRMLMKRAQNASAA